MFESSSLHKKYPLGLFGNTELLYTLESWILDTVQNVLSGFWFLKVIKSSIPHHCSSTWCLPPHSPVSGPAHVAIVSH